MAEGHVNDEMIEIGDPTEEPAAPEAAPKVVIQYHERGGVPWMLIPPLLVISAVAAVLLYIKLAPPKIHPQTAVLVQEVEVARPVVDEELPPPSPPVRPPSTAFAELSGEMRDDEAIPVVALPATAPAVPPPAPVEPAKVALAEPEATPPPRVEGLGFDPKALEADRRGAGQADPALAPAAREDIPDDRDKPREVDPDLLPPDPRIARARQQQRREEAWKKIEEERVRFHADLKVICRKFREYSGPEIQNLMKKYDIKVEPSAEKIAAQLLGRSGKFVGADRRTRIEVLRGLGYPEPVILDDLYVTHEKKTIGERDGPRSPAEAYYYSALFLLRHPPATPNSAARPVSSTTNTPASSALGNATVPAR